MDWRAELVMVGLVAFLAGQFTSPENRRRFRWWLERQAKVQDDGGAKVLAKERARQERAMRIASGAG